MKENQKLYYKAKFIIIGESGVGKTNLVHRFAKGEFNSQYAITLGMDYLTKNIKVNDKIFKLELWDTAGSEKFRSVSKGYYKNSACAIIVYDITDEKSFKSVKSWIEDCKSNSHKKIQIILVGNKRDLENQRIIEENMGKELAKENGIKFYETSALTGENVENLFVDECKILSKNINEGIIDFDDDTFGLKKCLTTTDIVINNSDKKLKLENEITKKKKKCC